jgi:Tol biopolymer transport system component
MGIAACVLAAAVGGIAINGRSALPQRGASGLITLTHVYGGESHILAVDPSGRRRPRDLGPGWSASWSPDGRKLVFTYEVDVDFTYGGGVGALVGRGLGGGLERFFVMNANGSGRHLLAMPWLGSPRFEDADPAWSPDGNRIAFTRTVWPAGAAHTQWSSGRSAVYVLELAHGGPRRVSMTFDSENANVTWSPDGRRLAYLAPASRPPCLGLHVTNADGTGDHVLEAASRSPGAPGGCAPILTPAWSPDGHRIAFGRLTNAPASIDARLTNAPPSIDLYLISPNGKHLHRLTHQPNRINVSPAWSPDGKRIAFEVGRPSDRGGPPLRTLAVIDRDGSHRHTILHVRGYLYGHGPAWQPRRI